jgi:hypothetical protein
VALALTVADWLAGAGVYVVPPPVTPVAVIV